MEIPLENSGEYKVIYENFNQMVRELKNADEQQKQFMKDFSHEFKTPIHSIKGMAEYLLHNEIPREEEKEYLNVMAKEAGRLVIKTGAYGSVSEKRRIPARFPDS